MFTNRRPPSTQFERYAAKPAATRDAALDTLITLAQREYGGDWDEITRTTAVRVR